MDTQSKLKIKIREDLDTEISALRSISSSNHDMWDNHILTLSTAAIGFSFSFYESQMSLGAILFALSLISMVVSIFSAVVNFWFADSAANQAMRKANAKSKYIRKLDIEEMKYEISKDSLVEGQYQEAEQLYEEYIKAKESIQVEFTDTDEKKLESLNSWINRLNILKTIGFLVGITLLTVFFFINK